MDSSNKKNYTIVGSTGDIIIIYSETINFPSRRYKCDVAGNKLVSLNSRKDFDPYYGNCHNFYVNY